MQRSLYAKVLQSPAMELKSHAPEYATKSKQNLMAGIEKCCSQEDKL